MRPKPETTKVRRPFSSVIRSQTQQQIYADYQVAESLNLELDYKDETSDFRKTNFPARYIYERTLPAAVAKHSDIYYHRASPYSGFGKPTTDKTYGDIHQCEWRADSERDV
jgi:beta-mannosidase